VRPQIEQVIVSFCMEQSAIQNIPFLDDESKRRLVQALVGMALDNVLKDAEKILASPEIRLEALLEQAREVEAMMGPRRLLWYRIRHNPRKILGSLLVSMTVILMYQLRHVPVVAQMLSVAGRACTQVGGGLSVATRCGWTLATDALETSAAFVEKVYKRCYEKRI